MIVFRKFFSFSPISVVEWIRQLPATLFLSPQRERQILFGGKKNVFQFGMNARPNHHKVVPSLSFVKGGKKCYSNTAGKVRSRTAGLLFSVSICIRHGMHNNNNNNNRRHSKKKNAAVCYILLWGRKHDQERRPSTRDIWSFLLFLFFFLSLSWVLVHGCRVTAFLFFFLKKNNKRNTLSPLEGLELVSSQATRWQLQE